MKRKILYILTTAVISLAAFSIGKFTADATNIHKIKDLSATEYGMSMTFDNNKKIFVDTESLEKAGLINTANIVDWNTDGQELAVITKNDCEYYAYKSADVYQNRAFVPVEK